MHFGPQAHTGPSTNLRSVSLALPIQIVNRLAYCMAELSRSIFHVTYFSIRRTLIGHLAVVGKSSYTLLDRACERSTPQVCLRSRW